MKKKIYIVFQEWESKHGDRDSQILGVTFNHEEAVDILKEERDTILGEQSLSVEEIAADDNFDIEDEPEHFYLADYFGGWDEINIIERDVECQF